MKAAALAIAFAAGLASAAPAPRMDPLPAAVAADFPTLRATGHARFTKWWRHVYDATLWTPGPRWSAAEPFALDLRYALRIPGRALADHSVAEMRRLGAGDEAQLARWHARMARVFPDIRPGDRLVGVAIPGREARFYGEERLLGVIEDADFGRAFFAIWLDERTSEPGLRRDLLAAPSPATNEAAR